MFDILNLGSRAAQFRTGPEHQPYSKVILQVTDELGYEVGDDTGRTLTLSCPWGSQAMAQAILDGLSGYLYQPYEAGDALIHPAVELGDGVSIKGVYSGIYNAGIKFGPLYKADISAPEAEEIDHEYPYEPPKDRKVTRALNGLSASLKITAEAIVAEAAAREAEDSQIRSRLSVHADLISAKVSKTGGEASSFGWELDERSWTIKAGSRAVLTATKEGLSIRGKIDATSGTIGGFSIGRDCIQYNEQTWGGTNTRGIYIGPSGIQLGKADSGFSVDSNGRLEASTGNFRGSVHAGNIKYGGSSGTFHGAGLTGGSVSGGWGGAIGSGTITTANTSGGINTSLGYADFAFSVLQGVNAFGHLRGTRMAAAYMELAGHELGRTTIAYTTSTGTTNYANVVTWR